MIFLNQYKITEPVMWIVLFSSVSLAFWTAISSLSFAIFSLFLTCHSSKLIVMQLEPPYEQKINVRKSEVNDIKNKMVKKQIGM